MKIMPHMRSVSIVISIVVECPRSIYHIIKTQERFFQNRCIELCKRAPRQHDEWEVSLVSYDGIMPKYQDYYCRCKEAISDRSIIEAGLRRHA